MKSILHLNSYFICNKLYSELYAKLDQQFVQDVYIPLKPNRSEINKGEFCNLTLHYSKVIKRYHKVFYFNKIKALTTDLINRKLHENADIVHAHNLFIDGALAYNLKNEFGNKYIVAIRSTDVALQYKYMIHRRRFARKILSNADSVIFISAVYKDMFLDFFDDGFKKSIENKSRVIPNGINDFWFNNQSVKAHLARGEALKLLYLGKIIKRKNVIALIKAVEIMNAQNIRVDLTVIGGEIAAEEKYYKAFLAKIKNKNNITFLGKVTSMEKVLDEFRKSHIFVMPSRRELFGIVYIEAISQNLPVIYSSNEGISSYLQNAVFAKGVNPDNVGSIVEGIQQLAGVRGNLGDCSSFALNFNWNDLSNIYKNIYDEIIGRPPN